MNVLAKAPGLYETHTTLDIQGEKTMKRSLIFSLRFYLLLIAVFAIMVAQAEAQTRPSPPTGLWIFDRSHVSFQVRWNASDTGGGAPVTGYNVRYRLPDPRLDFTDAGYTVTSTSIELTGLTPNTSYEVQARAISADGNSDWSQPTYTITLGWQAPLTMPSDLVASGITGDSVRVSWIAPYTVDGAVLTGYEVTYRVYAVVHGDAEPRIDAGHTGTEPFFVITGLSEDTNYEIQVVALTSDGKRHYSPHLFVTTAGFRPSPPSEITAASTTSSFRLSWNAPRTPDDIPITGYDVRYRSMEIRWVNGNRVLFPYVEVNANGTDTTFELAGLEPSASYEVGVRTVVANSKSDWSPALYVSTRNTFRMDQPSVSERTRTSLRVSWTTPDATEGFTITGYKVRYRPSVHGQNASPYVEVSPAGTETTITLTNLTPGTGYEIGLLTVGANGNSLWSVPIYAATYNAFPIDAPSGLTVSEKTSSSFRVSWSVPNAAEGITITGYEVRYRPAVYGNNPPSDYIKISPAGTETTVKLTGLQSSVSYEIGLRALGTIGNSVWRGPVYVSTTPYGDLNGDGAINILDLTLVASNLGQTGENVADLNRDGVVDIRDLVQLQILMNAGN